MGKEWGEQVGGGEQQGEELWGCGVDNRVRHQVRIPCGGG